MSKSTLKKWLSYIYDIGIESVSSSYNESLELVLSNGRYQLLTQGAIYSYEDKYDNYKIAMGAYQLDDYNINEVLILGLGMASIPIILEKIYHQKYHYTGVEIDESVIYLTSKYILDDLKSPLDIIQTDAFVFMELNHATYDMICMDVFIDDKIPEEFHQEDFLLKIKDSLSPNGLLFFNWLAVSDKDLKIVNNYFESIFKEVFPDGISYKLANNRMLINKAPASI